VVFGACRGATPPPLYRVVDVRRLLLPLSGQKLPFDAVGIRLAMETLECWNTHQPRIHTSEIDNTSDDAGRTPHLHRLLPASPEWSIWMMNLSILLVWRRLMDGMRSEYMFQRALARLHGLAGTSCVAGAVIAMGFVAMNIKRCCGREIRTTVLFQKYVGG
jgi:hypothetical protein